MPDFVRTARRFALAVLLCAGLAACGGTEPLTQPEREAAFRAAVADARVAEASEIVTSLTPIVPRNDRLRWRTVRTAAGDSVREVRMVTWATSDPLPGADTTATPGAALSLTDVVWATAVPEIQQFCRSLDRSGERMNRRLRQRLGLRPDDAPTRFVELWVRPSALARPCPDPAITDRECELQPPGPPTAVTVDPSYRTWFTRQRAQEYGPEGYPWTRLGYTYDWHPSADEVGISEFIVRPGATVTVHAVASTAAYCAAE